MVIELTSCIAYDKQLSIALAWLHHRIRQGHRVKPSKPVNTRTSRVIRPAVPQIPRARRYRHHCATELNEISAT